MFTKTLAATVLAIFLGTMAAANAQSFEGWNAGQYSDSYMAPRHDPANTNGF